MNPLCVIAIAIFIAALRHAAMTHSCPPQVTSPEHEESSGEEIPSMKFVVLAQDFGSQNDRHRFWLIICRTILLMMQFWERDASSQHSLFVRDQTSLQQNISN